MIREADIVDRACELEQRLTHAYIEHARNRANEVEAGGACNYCDEPIAPALKFCDAQCRDDWQRERDARKRAGLGQ
jgi:hypothetical protein